MEDTVVAHKDVIVQIVLALHGTVLMETCLVESCPFFIHFCGD